MDLINTIYYDECTQVKSLKIIVKTNVLPNFNYIIIFRDKNCNNYYCGNALKRIKQI